MDRWVRLGTEWLIELQNSDAGWGYYPGGASSVEPTALSCLSLLAGHRLQPREVVRDTVVRAAEWLSGVQNRDGWLGITSEMSEAAWPTPYAILLWRNLQGFADESNRAVDWLLKQKGKPLEDMGVYGHDVTLEGWPWISGTHSWLEPTAVAVMALRRSKRLNHPRTRQGIELILDRVIDGGGWNYGNSSVLGQKLRPQPAPTGLALLALANLEVSRDVVTASCSYLYEILQETRSPVSLSWGILGLTAWNDRPELAKKWLEESFDLLRVGAIPTMSLACLLLAVSEDSYGLFNTD